MMRTNGWNKNNYNHNYNTNTYSNNNNSDVELEYNSVSCEHAQSGVIKHEFNDYHDQDQVQEPNNLPGKYAVVVFGTTGVGKSSLIRLFCDSSGTNIKVSSSSDSATKHCRLYQEESTATCNRQDQDQDQDRSIDSRVWLDTQGTDDTDMLDCNEKVLKSILRKLFEHQIRKIKLIWMVSGDLTKEKEELCQQARFMKALLKSETQNIWESCLIIAKQKPLEPKQHTIAGLLSIVSDGHQHHQLELEQGQEQEQHNIIGFTAFDWMSDADKSRDMMLQVLLPQMQNEKVEDALALATFSYLNNSQIVKQVNTRLATMKCLKIEYLSEQCTRCGIIGDHRLIYAKCHSSIQYYHHQDLEWCHLEQKTKWCHSGGTITTTLSEEALRSIKKTRLIAGSAGAVLVGSACVLTFGVPLAPPITSLIGAGVATTAMSALAVIRHKEKRVLQKHTAYECCGKNVTEEQKKAEIDPGSVGCTLVYSCCGYCACARSQLKDIECICRTELTGCYARYTCCGRGINEPGCKERCSTCRAEWGSQPGCSITIDEELIAC